MWESFITTIPSLYTQEVIMERDPMSAVHVERPLPTALLLPA